MLPSNHKPDSKILKISNMEIKMEISLNISQAISNYIMWPAASNTDLKMLMTKQTTWNIMNISNFVVMTVPTDGLSSVVKIITKFRFCVITWPLSH